MSPRQGSSNGYVTKKKSLADSVCSSLVPDAASDGVCGAGDTAGGADVVAAASGSAPLGSAPQHVRVGSDTAGFVVAAESSLGMGAEATLGGPFAS